MHSSSAACVRGGMRLISSTSKQIGENRAGVKGEGIGSGLEDRGAQNVGGHQVGRALHALEAEAEQPADRFHDESFGDSRHAFKQRVALREHGDKHFADHLALPGDHAPQLRARVGQQLLRRPEGCACVSMRCSDGFLSFPFPRSKFRTHPLPAAAS